MTKRNSRGQKRSPFTCKIEMACRTGPKPRLRWVGLRYAQSFDTQSFVLGELRVWTRIKSFLPSHSFRPDKSSGNTPVFLCTSSFVLTSEAYSFTRCTSYSSWSFELSRFVSPRRLPTDLSCYIVSYIVLHRSINNIIIAFVRRGVATYRKSRKRTTRKKNRALATRRSTCRIPGRAW